MTISMYRSNPKFDELDFLLTMRARLKNPSVHFDLKDLPPDANTIDFENDHAYDVHFIYSQNGKTKAELFTKEFIQNQTAKPPYMEMMKGVKTNNQTHGR